MDNVSSSLERLSAQFAVRNKPFPLKSLLELYIKNERIADSTSSLYCGYFEGFRWLVDWLKPIEIPTAPFPPVPDILISYEIAQIAIIVGTSNETIWHLVMEIYNEQR